MYMYEPAIIKETSEGMSRYSVHDAMFQRREIQCIGSVDADMVNSLIAQIRYLAAEAPDSYKGNETAALGHKWGEWVRTKEPTTSAEGEDTRTCTRSGCGKTETRAVEKLPEETEPPVADCTSHEYEWVCDSSWEFDTGTCKNCGETKVTVSDILDIKILPIV